MRKVMPALLAVFLFSPMVRAQQGGAWADKLFGNDTVHDFGNVARGAQLKYTFKMTNIYKVPLDITDIRIQCGCVKAEPAVKVIQPNETVNLNVSMDARQFVGQKTVRIYLTVGPKYVSTATLTVSANARGDIAFSPNELDFGTLQGGQAIAKTIDIEYHGGRPDWRVTEIVKNGSAPFELKVEPLPGTPGGPPRKGYRITATMKPDAPSGAFKQEVVLKTNDAAGPSLTFNVTGAVQANLAVSQASVVVRDLKVGDTMSKKVFIRASQPFRIVGVDGQGDGITVEYANREDSTQVVTVSLAPTKAGEIRRQLSIRTDRGEMTPLVVEAKVEP